MSPNVRLEVDLAFNDLAKLSVTTLAARRSSLEEEPSDERVMFLAAALSAFYNGAEQILKRILKDLRSEPSQGSRWHADLLVSAASSEIAGGLIISEETYEDLAEFLGFRHLFRSTYWFQVEFERMKGLIERFDQTLSRFRSEVYAFLEQST